MKTIQSSAFPEETPDQITSRFKSKKQKTGEKLLREFLAKEGPYKFCKMAEEIRDKSPEYCREHYDMTPAAIWSVCNAIFSEFTVWRFNIEEFLKKIQKEPFFNLSSFIDSKASKPKPTKQIRRNQNRPADGEDL